MPKTSGITPNQTLLKPMKRAMTRGVALRATSAFFLAAAFCAAVPKSFG